MKRILNNRGFTLIELLAALVILTAIMGIAIPSISSSLERTKAKQDESRIKVLESAAELFVTDHKNAIYNKLGTSTSCYILLSDLDVSEDSLKNSSDQEFQGVIIFTKPTSSSASKYTFSEGSIPSNGKVTYGGSSLSECY